MVIADDSRRLRSFRIAPLQLNQTSLSSAHAAGASFIFTQRGVASLEDAAELLTAAQRREELEARRAEDREALIEQAILSAQASARPGKSLKLAPGFSRDELACAWHTLRIDASKLPVAPRRSDDPIVYSVGSLIIAASLTAKILYRAH